MESNEISMFMDVKLDISEKSTESSKFKSWTKCLVKIEAIKCFPCFLRITFIRNVEDESANLSVSINIIGITISMATSRTKQHSYGIFWTQNRKRCFIYFALDSDESCKRHMKWIKKSIKNMELHRMVFMETRRSSRGRLEGNLDQRRSDSEKSKDDNVNPQDILGPLPQIPDNDFMNWSRRVSGFSGIYEEISENDPRLSRRVSKVSIASGIYEEMKPFPKGHEIKKESIPSPAPPLPPRKRVNTFEPEFVAIPRSNTNPETELAKKKKYKNVIENIFGRSKRSESVSEGKVCTAEDLITPKICSTPEDVKTDSDEHIYENTPMRRRERIFGSARKIANKRNSFSSPDLSKINVFDDFEPLDAVNSLSSELQSWDLCESAEGGQNTSALSNPTSEELNISEQIQPNFNFSCNSSTVNLVGSNLHTKSIPPAKVLIDDLSGYCAMAPIKNAKAKKSVDEKKVVIDEQSDYCVMVPHKKTEQPKAKVLVDDPSGYCTMSAIKRPNVIVSNDSDKENDDKLPEPADKQKDDNAIYENMTRPREQELEQTEIIYENLTDFGKPNIFLLGGGKEKTAPKACEEPEEEYYQTPRKLITSIDDKIPSYYPNSCDTAKTRRRSPGKVTEISVKQVSAVKRHENYYVSSPQRIIEHRKKKDDKDSVKKSPLLARKVSENVYTVLRLEAETKTGASPPNKSPKIIEISIDAAKSLAALQNIDFKFDDTKNESDLKSGSKASETSSRIYQKYATITRISPNRYLDKCAKKTPSPPTTAGIEIGTVKKFASLPRFKKIDFSPLKMRINNVLQRHHHDDA